MRWFDKLFRRTSLMPLGKRGELAAAKYLKKLGYKIIAQGSRFKRGEIDVIAVDGQTVVFAEVKTRSKLDEDSPAAAVDLEKQRRLTRSALLFSKKHGLLNTAARFDVISIYWPKEAKRPEIEHIKNAFEPTEKWQLFG